MLARNVADAVTPPKVEAAEVEILDAEQIVALLDALKGTHVALYREPWARHRLRRGELLALRWQDVNLDEASLKVERSLEQTKGGLRFKSPKTRHSRRTISLPPSAVAMLRDHRKSQLELRMQLGRGKHEPDALVFCDHESVPISPNYFSIMWRRVISRNPGLPQVTFHALRHSHASRH